MKKEEGGREGRERGEGEEEEGGRWRGRRERGEGEEEEGREQRKMHRSHPEGRDLEYFCKL